MPRIQNFPKWRGVCSSMILVFCFAAFFLLEETSAFIVDHSKSTILKSYHIRRCQPQRNNGNNNKSYYYCNDKSFMRSPIINIPTLLSATPMTKLDDENNPIAVEITSSSTDDEEEKSSRIYDHEYVWIWDDEGGHWNRPEQHKQQKHDSSSSMTVTSTVRNWCENFVLALDLCPWAKASIQTKGAMRFFLVPPPSSNNNNAEFMNDWEDISMEENELLLEEKERRRMSNIIDDIAERFQSEILNDTNDVSDRLERAAIYFVVFLSEDDSSSFVLSDSFVDFIDWFTEVEEDWSEEFDDVIVAPFHPRWEFGGGDDDDEEACLDYEKRSPYPLVTLVSTRVVERAGEAVTEAIGEHNREILMGIEKEQKKKKDHHRQSPTPPKTITIHPKNNKISRKNASVAELWRSAVYGERTAHGSTSSI